MGQKSDTFKGHADTEGDELEGSQLELTKKRRSTLAPNMQNFKNLKQVKNIHDIYNFKD
jgi:hypothetical protein